GRNDTHEIFLQLWNGSRIVYSRKGEYLHTGQCVVVPRPFACLFGNLTPCNLSKLVGQSGQTDGWAARFLYCFPEESAWWDGRQDDTTHAVADNAWRGVVRRLYSMPVDASFRMSAAAQHIWRRFRIMLLRSARSNGVSEAMAASLGKLPGYGA